MGDHPKRIQIKPIRPGDETMLLCQRADRPPPGDPPVPCVGGKCGTCGPEVWVSEGTKRSVLDIKGAKVTICCPQCCKPEETDEITATPETFGEVMKHG